MAAGTIARPTLSEELPKTGYVVERARVPLFLKLFGLTALLIVIVIAIAIGITLQRARRVAEETVRTSIAGAANLFRDFEKQRLASLTLATELTGNDPAFVAYIMTATGGTTVDSDALPASPVVDLASINDILLQRREQLGSDVLMLLDDQGVLVARTDQPMVATSTREDLYETTTLVRQIVDDASVTHTAGVLSLAGKLYHAAVAPVGAGARNVRSGYLINAYAVDEEFANRIAGSTRAGVVFTSAEGNSPVRSSDAPAVKRSAVTVGETREVSVDDSRYIATALPLLSGTNVAGHAIFLRSLDRELAPFRQINNALLAGGGVALLLAFFLSWLIARRLTRPIEQLAGMAQAVTAGDYTINPDIDRNDEIGILGRSFGKMINSLRDKADLEALYAEMTGTPTESSIATMKMSATPAGQTGSGPAMDLSAGHLFAHRYRIEQILGRGGMGVVYKATDTQLDETVAIKTLPGDVMTNSPEDLERFKREIRLARRITHRNVLRTFDYGEAEGVYFISMEFVRGHTLAELLDETPNRQLATRVVSGIARQICRGLQAAHEQGIIHRDIKPQNVLIDPKGEVKLMDFGIARVAEAAEGVTQAGLVVGTPHYMSPEQVQGKQLDVRSDVYSMGVLIYEMLTGKRPFESTSLTAVLTSHITELPKPPDETRADVPAELSAIVMRCLAKDPRARYEDAAALLTDLETQRNVAA